MGFEPMISFQYIDLADQCLKPLSQLIYGIINFNPAAGSPTTTMLRLHPGYHPYGQLNKFLFNLYLSNS